MAKTRVDNYQINRGMNIVRPRQRFKFKPAPGPNFQPVTEVPAPMPVAPALKDLIVYVSPHEQCGIREYGRELDAQLQALGVSLTETPLNYLAPLWNAAPGQPFLIHVEPSLLNPDFDNALASSLQRGAYVALCFHYLDEPIYQRFKNRAHAMVRHRDYGVGDPRMHEVPLGCPVFDPPANKRELREKYGLPLDKKVLTTVGFLAPWKKIPDLTQALLSKLAPNEHLQLICPAHFSGESHQEWHRLNSVTNGSERVTWTSQFVPQQELLERVAASDLGFVFHAVNTGSCSAATKPFVSARCPVVITNSNHASDVREGAYRAPTMDLHGFADAVIGVARNPHSLHQYVSGMQRDYERLNMRRVAEQYLDVFRKIGVNLT